MKQQVVSIIGGETLLGRELREQLTETGFPGKVQLLGSDEEVTGILAAEGGEPLIIPPVDAERLHDSSVVFLAGLPIASRKAVELVSSARRKPPLIDLTYTLEDEPGARLRAPLLEPAGYGTDKTLHHVVAHPAAIVLAAIFDRLKEVASIERAVVQIFEPVSERGQAGLLELQQQTASLLSFKTLPRTIFDAQASFNMLPRYGEDAPEHLQNIELRIERHLATLFAALRIERMPSIRLAQAPVFHGYSISLWVEFGDSTAKSALSERVSVALAASPHLDVRDADLDPPTNVGAVGQSGATVGLVEADRNNPRAVWLWAVADNFRVSVDHAIAVARALLPASRK